MIIHNSTMNFINYFRTSFLMKSIDVLSNNSF